ncbi:hypothetical protein [Kiloniella majae]|uniref:hypothetical protein n=1 Tax=Kiloniella majae TaxID=1938558 RepID=UPI000F7A20A2|nr:hypothetical protein [Kiloniella majae]
MAAYTNPELFNQMYRAGTMLAKSQLVPKHLQKKQEDCTLVCIMALDLRINPIMLAQNIFFVHGTPGWKTTYLISCANQCGKLEHPITFETKGSGESLEVTATAKLKDKFGGKNISQSVSMAMAKAEGWTSNTKYQSIPELMLSYRSATFLIRLHMPEVMYGMKTTDELDDIQASGELKADPYGTYKPNLQAATAQKPAKPEPELVDIDQEEVPDFKDATELSWSVTDWNGQVFECAGEDELEEKVMELIQSAPDRQTGYQMLEHLKSPDTIDAYEAAWPQDETTNQE